MFNEVILVGRIKDMGNVDENKREIILEVERPFNENEGKKYDLFVCKLWNAIFNKVISYCSYGDVIIMKGRLLYDNDSYYVMAENVVLLNKSLNNISKQ